MSALLTADEIAAIYKVTGRQVRIWAAEGKIPTAVSEGRILRFDADEVAKALAKRAKRKPAKANTTGMIPTY